MLWDGLEISDELCIAIPTSFVISSSLSSTSWCAPSSSVEWFVEAIAPLTTLSWTSWCSPGSSAERFEVFRIVEVFGGETFSVFLYLNKQTVNHFVKTSPSYFSKDYLRWREDGRDIIRMIMVESNRTFRNEMFRTNDGIFRRNPWCSILVISTNSLNPKWSLFFVARFRRKAEKSIHLLAGMVWAANYAAVICSTWFSWRFSIHFLDQNT